MYSDAIALYFLCDCFFVLDKYACNKPGAMRSAALGYLWYFPRCAGVVRTGKFRCIFSCLWFAAHSFVDGSTPRNSHGYGFVLKVLVTSALREKLQSNVVACFVRSKMYRYC